MNIVILQGLHLLVLGIIFDSIYCMFESTYIAELWYINIYIYKHIYLFTSFAFDVVSEQWHGVETSLW